MFTEFRFSIIRKYLYVIVFKIVLKGIYSTFVKIGRADTQYNMLYTRRCNQFGNTFKTYRFNIKYIGEYMNGTRLFYSNTLNSIFSTIV